MFMTYNKGAFFLKGSTRTISEIMYKKTNLVGWKHDKINGWFTTKITSAFLMREHADDRAKNILNKSFIQHTPNKKVLVIPNGLKLLPHQPGTVRYALSRNRSYLALDPGLGKTPIAALITQAMNAATIYICPPFLALNTLEEFQKWNPKMSIEILGSHDWIVPDVLIIPDSIISHPHTREYIRFFNPKVIIVDEAHRYKELTAKRSKALFGYVDRRKQNSIVPGIVDARELQKLIYMSGTPVPNRPLELFPVLHKSAPEYIDFDSKDSFGMKYCGGFYNGHGFDYKGANEKELTKLRNRFVSKDDKDDKGFMLRLHKELLGLPPLLEELVILGDEMNPELKNLDKSVTKRLGKDMMKAVIAATRKQNEDELHISTYRRLLGMHKVEPSFKYINSILEETEENLLVFAYHKDVIKSLAEKLKAFRPLVITGDTPKEKRHAIIKEYQSSKERRLILGNIDAMGVGYTITKANRCIGVEWSWVPGVNRQIIDRVHRYGLKHSLLAQFLAFRNSLDITMYNTNERKKKVTGII
jgi:SWI/SNF-related matrix-associated actin-dependent regulator 1 of chromatin subfamily A